MSFQSGYCPVAGSIPFPHTAVRTWPQALHACASSSSSRKSKSPVSDGSRDEATNIGSLNLLVVDDDAFQRRAVASILLAMGAVSIEEAENGRQALDLVRRSGHRPIDVVICDLKMPEMDGLEFIRLLGQEQRNIAIVIVSALGGKLLLSAGKMAKMHGIKLLGVVEKPLTPKRIAEPLAKYGQTGNKWQQPDTTRTFSLEEVMQAIHEKQFEPFFQPKLDMNTGRLLGAEALARWIHPEHGIITPQDFIPQLEAGGDIDALTFLILEKAASACRDYCKLGHNLNIAVNLSLVSLGDIMLADKITRVVHEAGVEPRNMVLEITETAAMSNLAHSMENLARLYMNGFVLSIDDYGTGYSSLQQLMRIPFGELKIDQSFVRGFADDDMHRIVIESSIDMAHKLSVKSMAEGVETRQDWEILRDLGCDAAQGEFIAMPMSGDAFCEFCASHEPGAFV